MLRCLGYDLRRIFMSRSIWAYLALSAFLPLLLSIDGFPSEGDAAAYLIRQFIISGSLFCAVFTALFTGRSVSDKTLKNRIATGTKRSSLYFAELLSTIIFMICCFLVYTGVALVICGAGNKEEILLSVLVILLWLLLFCVLYVFINIYFTMNIFAVFLSLVFVFALLSCGMNLDTRLSEPQYTDTELKTENPRYISGFQRDVFAFLLDSNPYGLLYYESGSSLIINTAELTLPLTFITVLGGTAAFCRKELD